MRKMMELFHTKGNRHVNGEFEVYRVVVGEVAFVHTSPELKDPSIILATEGDMFNVIPYYFHRAINISIKKPLVTSDIRPLNTKTSYSPVDEKGFPVNIVQDKDNNLFLLKKGNELLPLNEDIPEVQRATHHSHIKIAQSLIDEIIKDAQSNQLEIGKPYKKTGYIVSNIRKVSEMKDFYINAEEAAKIDDIVYITLDGRLEEVNMINGLTIIFPGTIPL
ncbi:MAG: hypothetical protein HWN66_15245 [Candidatus Helarchaeota archaeon]|nr:hypothetical protein [Candidatus Helarchaeota archaeon]